MHIANLNKKFYFMVYCLFLLPFAYILTSMVLYSQNSLYLNNKWIVKKRVMEMGVMGGDEFLLTRIPLYKNSLNLGRYFGNQTVLLRDKISPRSIKFRFIVPTDSHLDFLYNYDNKSFKGIRISNRLDLPSLLYESDLDGHFLKKKNLSFVINKTVWNSISLKTQSDKVVLSLNDKQTLILDSSFSAGMIGFHSGLRGANIDDVEIRTQSGSKINESFDNIKKEYPLFIILFSFFAVLGGTTLKIVRNDLRKFFFIMIVFISTSTATASLWFIFDYFYYSGLIPVKNGITHDLFPTHKTTMLSFEEIRHAVFKSIYHLTSAPIISHSGLSERGYPLEQLWEGPIVCLYNTDFCSALKSPSHLRMSHHNGKIYRVVFIGTSQTIGAGASELAKTFVVRNHFIVQKLLPKNIGFESINMAISGSNSKELYELYQKNYLALKPDLVIINLSNNDTNEDFKISIINFLELNRLNKVKTLFLEEANSRESDQENELLANHKVLRELALKYNIPVLPLHDYLKSNDVFESGILWWDFVHLTSYGQELVAKWLAPKLIKELLLLPARDREFLDIYNPVGNTIEEPSRNPK